MIKDKNIIEFGDFQTPTLLVNKMIDILSEFHLNPSVIFEPTCGTGEILFRSSDYFKPEKSIGIEINPKYVEIAKGKINRENNIIIHNEDIFSYFKLNKDQIDEKFELLFIGNPPWVTNSTIGSIEGNNIPLKSNFKKLNGIEAITGKSNFDIAEYILLFLIEKFSKNLSVFAFLCKTIVARNLLKWIWQKKIKYNNARIYPIDSKKYFSAAVDACYFIIDFREKRLNLTCDTYDSIEARNKKSTYCFQDNIIINNLEKFNSNNVFGKSDYKWRNGIKHDCSKVMEFIIKNNKFINGYGSVVEIENDLLYPMLKSSDLQKDNPKIRKYVLVTQQYIGEDTQEIKLKFPKTWKYLYSYREILNSRKSSIYKNKPLFSIFSIGDYSFYPFKVAISALYKTIKFVKIGSLDGKPILVDDTCNFIPCFSEPEADLILYLLKNSVSYDFLNSIIFWDSKRPVTTEVLNKLSLSKLAKKFNKELAYNEFINNNNEIDKVNAYQMSIF